MTLKRSKINRGQALALAVQRSGMTRKEVARRAGYSRSAYYKHIHEPNLAFHILIRYGRVLHHDFTEDIPDMPRYDLEEPEEHYEERPSTIDEAIRQRDYWKRRYYQLMERHAKIMERKLTGE